MTSLGLLGQEKLLGSSP